MSTTSTRRTSLTHITSHLLGQHVVVALPGERGQVVGLVRADARKAAVSVASARAAAHLEPLAGNGRRERLETTAGRVQVGQHV